MTGSSLTDIDERVVEGRKGRRSLFKSQNL